MDTPSRKDTTMKNPELINNLESRVGRLEGAMETLVNQVELTNKSIQTLAAKFDTQLSSIDAKLTHTQTKVFERDRVSWPLVVALITCAFLFGGSGVAFVNMTTAPINKDVIETRIDIDDHEKMGGHLDALVEQARQDERIRDAHYEIEKLHKFSDENIRQHGLTAAEVLAIKSKVESIEKQQDRRWPEIIAGAERRGVIDSTIQHMHDLIENIINEIKSSTGDRFYGREGEELKTRINDLERFLREQKE